MRNVFKVTPKYFHLLFTAVLCGGLFLLILLYQVENFLTPSFEAFATAGGIFVFAIIFLYCSSIYYFYKFHQEVKQNLFKTIIQNNVEYYLPHDNSEKSLYLHSTVVEEYNEMSHHFMQMMKNERNRLDTTISYIHDMKLPLTTLALILDKIEPQIPYEDYLSAQASIQRCNKYIGEQLYLSQLTDLTTNLYYEKFDLNQVWSEVIQELQATIMIKKLHIKKTGTQQIIRSDRRMVQFICMQLLQNAIQYTLEGGQISIVINEQKCTISDTGVGIPDYELPLIFNRGYTGKVYRKRKQSGMGLYLVNRLADVLDIKIDVVSQENHGSTFELQFEE